MPARSSLDQRIAALSAHWELHLPEGPGPFPVIVQLHGCGGKKPFQTTWAQVARNAGAAVIVIDSHKHRGISRLMAYGGVCTGAMLQGRERAGDLFAALAWARRQSWADPSKMIAAGWSHGGWTISDALSFRDHAEMVRATGLADLDEEPLAGLRGVFLVYPYLGVGTIRGRRWRLAPRTVAIIGGKDSIAGGWLPMSQLDRVRLGGTPVDIKVFETATHAFDEPEARDLRVRYDPELTTQGHALYEGLLRAL